MMFFCLAAVASPLQVFVDSNCKSISTCLGSMDNDPIR